MIKSLDTFEVKEKGIVKTVNGEKRIRRRLFDMGVTPGVEIIVVKKAPMGDPTEIHLRGYHLTLRNSECALIEVEKIKWSISL